MSFSRYCEGKQTTFCWDASGQSNLPELNIVLCRKFLIRRTKEQVEFQLKEKFRETIVLDRATVWKCEDEGSRETAENMKVYSQDIQTLKGNSREDVLLKFYAETGRMKANAVCTYLKKMISDDSVSKFLVFAHHLSMLDAITDCLDNLHVKAIRIDGTTRNDLRTTYVDKFQNDKSYRAAVLSLKACNAGITLTAANLVIFAELDWNPSTLAQAEARAHRIGQTSEVKCRYLLAPGTADDYIWDMLKKKQDTLNKAGLFSEDLSDATHSFDATSNGNSVKNYFAAEEKGDGGGEEPKAGPSTDHIDAKQSESVSKTVTAIGEDTKDEAGDAEFADLLNDGDDEEFLDLDF